MLNVTQNPSSSHQRILSGAINPYRIAYNFLMSRLRWDLHPYSWKSRRRIRAYKNLFKQQKALILCNGPSLNAVDFAHLARQNLFTFGLNKINLLFSRTPFRPSAVVAVNPYVIEQNALFFNHTIIPLFLDSKGRKWIQFRSNVIFLHSAGSLKQFAMDCSISVNQGYTVTYVALQIAFHMGFSCVGIVGCDHSFSSKGLPNEPVVSGVKDSDHFDPNYFAGGVTWQLPDLLGSEFHFEAARDTYEKFGRKIFNCTEGGKLEIFERKHLADFLEA
jgi:hypothetical protein